MSQHVIETVYRKQPVTLSIGWDRRLQGYFMTIRRLRTKNLVYSNLNDTDLASSYGLAEDLDFFKVKLSQLRVNIPAPVFDGVGQDAQCNVGNRVVVYEEDGRIRLDQMV